MQLLILVLLPAAFLLPPAAQAGEIIGGREARPHSRPYMVFVNIEAGGGGGDRCGGFLIREDVVVTAAHCNCNCNITVLLGAHNIAIGEPGRQEILVRRQIPHPDYNDETDENDIMLLQLEKKAKLNHDVNLIPLAYAPVAPKTMCCVTGWGRASTRIEVPSDMLREVDVEVMPDTDCPRIRNGPYRYYNPSTMLCAGDPHEGKSSFQGDSGGPLVCRGKAHGIVSFGPMNGIPPWVYTRVSSFSLWIQKTMKNLQP
ncbi:cathepsin G-like [Emydura macquarii macquarii]|uniref:cathepsin G-like n=1 Tax=Emydura macquarii macquarii TaxID=1129001 RepID=UPI00352A3EE1